MFHEGEKTQLPKQVATAGWLWQLGLLLRLHEKLVVAGIRMARKTFDDQGFQHRVTLEKDPSQDIA